MAGQPFDLTDGAGYAAWRATKLTAAPCSLDEIRVAIADPRSLSIAERDAILAAVTRCNMAIYALPPTEPATPEHELRRDLTALLARFGLVTVERHRSAEADGFVTIAVSDTPEKRGFIPYSTRPLNWHTDGYYNPPQTPVRAMLLHCIQDAASGGENALLDPEIAYIRVRDANPDWIAALMHPAAMAIPAAIEDDGQERPESIGPVFSVDPEDGSLVMRYTARARSISWRDTADTRDAAAFLADLLGNALEPLILRARLAPGEGLICNNVLHTRTGFAEAIDSRRRILRARFATRLRRVCGNTVGAP